jgi:hypothetical protein
MLYEAFGRPYLNSTVVLDHAVISVEFIGKCTQGEQMYVVGKCYHRSIFMSCPNPLNRLEMEPFEKMFSQSMTSSYKLPQQFYLAISSWETAPSDLKGIWDAADTLDCPES